MTCTQSGVITKVHDLLGQPLYIIDHPNNLIEPNWTKDLSCQEKVNSALALSLQGSVVVRPRKTSDRTEKCLTGALSVNSNSSKSAQINQSSGTEIQFG